MAKKSAKDILDVEEAYGKSEEFVIKHRKTLSIIGGILIALVLGYFAYKYFIREPHIEESLRMNWKAEYYFSIDSFQTALDGDIAGNPGFAYVAREYDGTPAGELASYYGGLCHLYLGNYTTAIDMIDAADIDDDVVGTMRLGNLGDAYVELGDVNKGIEYYEEAAQNNPENAFLVPHWGMKAAMMYEQSGNYQKAVEWYAKLEKDYPAHTNINTIRKYHARAKNKIAS